MKKNNLQTSVLVWIFKHQNMISGGESYSLQDLDSSVMSIARSVCQNVQWDSTMPPSTGHVLQQLDGHVLQQQDGRSVAPSEYQNQPAVDRRHLDTRPKIPGVAPGQGGTNVDQHYKGWLDSYGLNEHTIRSILDNGFTSKQLFMNMSEGDVDIMDIRPLAQPQWNDHELFMNGSWTVHVQFMNTYSWTVHELSMNMKWPSSWSWWGSWTWSS